MEMGMIVLFGATLFLGLLLYLFKSNEDTPVDSYRTTEQPRPTRSKLSCHNCTGSNVAWLHRCKDGTPDLRYATNTLVCKDCRQTKDYRLR